MKLPPDLPKIYLKPGELTISTQPTEVSTVLGSCVAITLFTPQYRIGAICHAMLPARTGHDVQNTVKFKYVDSALLHMIEYFKKRHIAPSTIEVKVFGGADMFDSPSAGSLVSVGRQNLDATQNLLCHHGLVIKTKDVGGQQGRKLIFFSHTGEVFLKRLEKNQFVQAG